MRFWMAGLLTCVACLARAEAESPSFLQTTIGLSGSSQTSPNMELTDLGVPVTLPGTQAHHQFQAQAEAQGSWQQETAPGHHVLLASHALWQRSAASQTDSLAQFSLQPSWNTAVLGLGVGVGPVWQAYRLGGQAFRIHTGWQVSLTRSDEQDLGSLMLDMGRNQHARDWQELDARTASLILQVRRQKPWPGVDALQAGLTFGRERNTQGLREWSARQTIVQLGAETRALGLNWSASSAWQFVQHDGANTPGSSPRHDRTQTLELQTRWAWTPSHCLQATWHGEIRRSNIAGLDNRLNQVSLAIVSDW
jgi:hypothetical protein